VIRLALVDDMFNKIVESNNYINFISNKCYTICNKFIFDRDLRFSFSFNKGYIKAINLTGSIKFNNIEKVSKITLTKEEKEILDNSYLKNLNSKQIILSDNKISTFSTDCLNIDDIDKIEDKDLQEKIKKMINKLKKYLLSYIDKLVKECAKENDNIIKEYIETL